MEQRIAVHHTVGTGNSTDVEQRICFTVAGKVTDDMCLPQMG